MTTTVESLATELETTEALLPFDNPTVTDSDTDNVLTSYAEPLDVTEIDGLLSEQRLIAAAKAGGEEAFAALYRLHKPGIVGYLRTKVSPSDAEDICQDTFFNAYRAMDSFEERGKGMRGWLTTIAYRLMVNQARSSKRRPEVHDENERAEPSPSVNPERVVLGQLAIHEAMARLSPDHRDAVYHVLILGMEPAAYAAQVGIDHRTVNTRIHRARKTLVARGLQALLLDEN